MELPRSGREARAAIFDRGHHLMADQDSLRELGFSPVRGFPWPRSITRQLTSESKIDRVSHCPRADYDASAETCDEFRLHRNSSVCYAEGDANSDRNAHGEGENVRSRFASSPRPPGEVAPSKTVTERADTHSAYTPNLQNGDSLPRSPSLRRAIPPQWHPAQLAQSWPQERSPVMTYCNSAMIPFVRLSNAFFASMYAA